MEDESAAESEGERGLCPPRESSKLVKDDNMDITLEMMQRVMLKKGLINKPISASQMKKLMEEEDMSDAPLDDEPSN